MYQVNSSALLHIDAAALWEDIEGLIHQHDRLVAAVIVQGSLDKHLHFHCHLASR